MSAAVSPPTAVRRLVCALGSNQGDSLALLRRAVTLLGRTAGVSLRAVSSVYRTAPVGGPEQPDYLNVVVVGETTLPATDLLRRAQAVEQALGRVRLERWGPRTIDIDLVVVGDLVLDTPELTLPHPRAHKRAFVLVPWLEAEPDAVLPGRGRVADLLLPLATDGVERLPDARIELA